MTVRFDAEARRLSVAVRDLLAEPPGDRFSMPGGLTLRRQRLGTAVHQEHQRQQEASLLSYRREVAVDFSTEVDQAPLPDGALGTVTLVVRGRIDGAFERAGKLVLEEIKSLVVPGGQLARLSRERRAPFAEQVAIYALILHAQGEPAERLVTELVLVSALDGRVHREPVAWRDYSIPGLIHARARAILGALAGIEAQRREKRARGAALPFPFPELRAGQGEMIAAIDAANAAREHLLIDAPTGLGKTAAALHAQVRAALLDGGTAFAVTAKNTQREIVVSTARRWQRAGHPVRLIALRAKAAMCANDIVLCHPEVCRYARDYEDKLAQHDLPASLFADDAVWTPDTLMAVATAREVCPFELALDAALQADVIVGDYNYVFDPSVALKRFFDPALAAVVAPLSRTADGRPAHRLIVDEAHNLVDRGREIYSPALARATCERARDQASDTPESRRLRAFAVELLAYADECAADAIARGVPLTECTPVEFDCGRFSDWRATAEEILADLLLQRRERIRREAQRRANAPPAGETAGGSDRIPTSAAPSATPGRRRARAARARTERAQTGTAKRPIVPDDPGLTLLYDLLRFETVLSLGPHKAFSHVLIAASDGRASALCIVCADPGPWLGTRHKDFATVVGMSGTLTPFVHYRDRLGLPAARTRQASLGSPFPRENFAVFVDASVRTQYRSREAEAPRIAAHVLQAARQRPGNYLVAFPSYAFLEQVATHWQQAHDPTLVLVQRREMDDRARRAFLCTLAQAPHGARLVAVVAGGLFAEGLDFPGELLVGAFIIGPSLPRFDEQHELIRRYFDARWRAHREAAKTRPSEPEVATEAEFVDADPDADEYADALADVVGSAGGSATRSGPATAPAAAATGAAPATGFDTVYRIPGMTRVIQTAGRVIRSAEDIGFIALVGERFARREARELFPAHWLDTSPYGPVLRVTRDLAGEVADFWRRHGLLSPGR